MAKLYKRFPTLEEAKVHAQELYDTDEEAIETFMEAVRWTLKECNRDRFPDEVCSTSSIRQLKVGQSMDFPLSQWASARTLASRLNKLYNVFMRVNKVRFELEDRIVVTRIY